MITAGFIIEDKDGLAIYGAARTEDEAWAQTVDGVGVFHDAQGEDISPEEARGQFVTHPATQALIDQVDEEGGAIYWVIMDGIACTEDEADAARPE